MLGAQPTDCDPALLVSLLLSLKPLRTDLLLLCPLFFFTKEGSSGATCDALCGTQDSARSSLCPFQPSCRFGAKVLTREKQVLQAGELLPGWVLPPHSGRADRRGAASCTGGLRRQWGAACHRRGCGWVESLHTRSRRAGRSVWDCHSPWTRFPWGSSVSLFPRCVGGTTAGLPVSAGGCSDRACLLNGCRDLKKWISASLGKCLGILQTPHGQRAIALIV